MFRALVFAVIDCGYDPRVAALIDGSEESLQSWSMESLRVGAPPNDPPNPLKEWRE
ncbi:MAG: hypothetical protein MI723_16825 [Caulobacterales bacterium]|nr:hypothetical protein [Caulobacterales bacterium]